MGSTPFGAKRSNPFSGSKPRAGSANTLPRAIRPESDGVNGMLAAIKPRLPPVGNSVSVIMASNPAKLKLLALVNMTIFTGLSTGTPGTGADFGPVGSPGSRQVQVAP